MFSSNSFIVLSLTFPSMMYVDLLFVCSVRWESRGFPGSSDSKETACNAWDWGLIPGMGRSPGEGNGNPLQYSLVKDSEAYHAIVHGVTKNGTWLSDWHTRGSFLSLYYHPVVPAPFVERW